MTRCPDCDLPLDRRVGACRECWEGRTRLCASHGGMLGSCNGCLRTGPVGRRRLARGACIHQQAEAKA
jgi:hypothetical protein